MEVLTTLYTQSCVSLYFKAVDITCSMEVLTTLYTQSCVSLYSKAVDITCSMEVLTTLYTQSCVSLYFKEMSHVAWRYLLHCTHKAVLACTSRL